MPLASLRTDSLCDKQEAPKVVLFTCSGSSLGKAILTRGYVCVYGSRTAFTSWRKMHKLTDCGTDEWRGVTDIVETFLLDKVSNSLGKVLVVGFDIILQNQTAQRSSWLI